MTTSKLSPPVIRAELLASEVTDIINALGFAAAAVERSDPEAARRLYALAGRMDDLR